jgi:hypothetical protein
MAEVYPVAIGRCAMVTIPASGLALVRIEFGDATKLLKVVVGAHSGIVVELADTNGGSVQSRTKRTESPHLTDAKML